MDKWETVHERMGKGPSARVSLDRTERMRVVGGWLYRTERLAQEPNDGSGDLYAVALVFVPEAV